jgi:hypothetical protein
MNITYKTDPHSSLHMYIECTTAAEHCTITDKTHTHSEYDTLWDNMLTDWANKGYYKYCQFEVLKGNSTVIFKFEFANGRQHAQTLITELDKYFDENARSWDIVDFISSKAIKDI